MRNKDEIKERLDRATEGKDILEMTYLGVLHDFYNPKIEARVKIDLQKSKEWLRTEKDPGGQKLLEQVINLLEWIINAPLNNPK